MESIADHIQVGLRILFVGYNPSIRSGQTGHHYANPSNRFWKMLHLSGITERRFKPEEDALLLNSGYGFTNIVARPTKAADEITKEEYIEGRSILMNKIRHYRPQVVCFVGKGVYQQYSGRRHIDWGIQPEPIVPGVVDFVAPSTSGLVRMELDEMTAIFKELASLIK